MAACRAGSSSQGCHGTSLLCLVFCRGPHQPLSDGTTFQAHLLTMSLSSCNGYQPRLFCTWRDFQLTSGFSRDVLISSLKNRLSFFFNYLGENIQNSDLRHSCCMITKREEFYCVRKNAYYLRRFSVPRVLRCPAGIDRGC